MASKDPFGGAQWKKRVVRKKKKRRVPSGGSAPLNVTPVMGGGSSAEVSEFYNAFDASPFAQKSKASGGEKAPAVDDDMVSVGGFSRKAIEDLTGKKHKAVTPTDDSEPAPSSPPVPSAEGRRASVVGIVVEMALPDLAEAPPPVPARRPSTDPTSNPWTQDGGSTPGGSGEAKPRVGSIRAKRRGSKARTRSVGKTSGKRMSTGRGASAARRKSRGRRRSTSKGLETSTGEDAELEEALKHLKELFPDEEAPPTGGSSKKKRRSRRASKVAIAGDDLYTPPARRETLTAEASTSKKAERGRSISPAAKRRSRSRSKSKSASFGQKAAKKLGKAHKKALAALEEPASPPPDRPVVVPQAPGATRRLVSNKRGLQKMESAVSFGATNGGGDRSDMVSVRSNSTVQSSLSGVTVGVAPVTGASRATAVRADDMYSMQAGGTAPSGTEAVGGDGKGKSGGGLFSRLFRGKSVSDEPAYRHADPFPADRAFTRQFIIVAQYRRFIIEKEMGFRELMELLSQADHAVFRALVEIVMDEKAAVGNDFYRAAMFTLEPQGRGLEALDAAIRAECAALVPVRRVEKFSEFSEPTVATNMWYGYNKLAFGGLYLMQTVGPTVRALVRKIKTSGALRIPDDFLPFLERLTDDLFRSVDSAPGELKWVCSVVHDGMMASRASSHATHAMGRFLFSHFLSPVIVIPEDFPFLGISESEITRDGRYALVLIGQTLEKMAAGEKWDDNSYSMRPLNLFIERNDRKMKKFLKTMSTAAASVPPPANRIPADVRDLAMIIFYAQMHFYQQALVDELNDKDKELRAAGKIQMAFRSHLRRSGKKKVVAVKEPMGVRLARARQPTLAELAKQVDALIGKIGAPPPVFQRPKSSTDYSAIVNA